MSDHLIRQLRTDADRAWRALLSGEDGAGAAFALAYRALGDALDYAARVQPDADGGPGAHLLRLARPTVDPSEWLGR